jgi:hypothetical protein
MPTMDDDRGAMREAGAVFEAARVRTSRGPRFLAIGVTLALAGLVGLGAINRLITPDKPASARATVGPAVAPARSTPVAQGSREPTTPQERTDRFVNGPDLPTPTAVDVIALDLRPFGRDLFVHGDIFSLAVVRVSVDLEDSQGSPVAAAAAVKIPGGSTAFRLGAVPRFDVRFSMPNVLLGNGVWITVTAYGDTGARLATVRRLVPRVSDAT